MWKKIGIVLLGISVLAMTGCGSTKTDKAADNKAEPKTLVVAGYGGSFEKGLKETIIPKFEKKYNVKITYITGISNDTLAKLKGQKDKPQIDVAIMDDGPQEVAKSLGLLAPLDAAKVSNLKNLYDIAKDSDNIGTAIGLTATAFAYNTKVFSENNWAPPTSWNDLNRPEFKGKVIAQAFSNTFGVHTLVMLAKSNGGSETNIEPGFANMKKLADNVVTFSKAGDVSNYFIQNEAVIGVWGSGYCNTLKAKNFPVEFVFPKEGAVALNVTASVVKNAPHQDLANEFINFILDEESQTALAKTVFYGPVNKTVKLDADTAKMVIYGSEQVGKLVKTDWKIVNEKRAEWTERVNKEIEVSK